ncbi:MAG: insulinase family protein [Isosphaeraceae bacterium]
MPHDCEQMQILIGHLGVERKHPDFVALAVLDHILGSGPGFTDRLSRVIRDELGLAYSIGGGITESADVAPGLFRVYVGTTPEEADRVVEAVVGEIQAVQRGAFSDEEVDRARRHVAGSTSRRWSSEPIACWSSSAGGWSSTSRLGGRRVAAITPAQVRKVARTHLHPLRHSVGSSTARRGGAGVAVPAAPEPSAAGAAARRFLDSLASVLLRYGPLPDGPESTHRRSTRPAPAVLHLVLTCRTRPARLLCDGASTAARRRPSARSTWLCRVGTRAAGRAAPEMGWV